MLISATLGAVNCLVVIGNLLVFYMILTKRSLQSTTNTLVLSLTISDLLLGILILPFAIIQEHNAEWLFGDIGCHLWLSLDVFLSTASIYNLLAISFDRYMAVRQPIKYTIVSSTRLVRLMLFLVWACSLLLAAVLFVLIHIIEVGVVVTNECQPTDLPSEYILFSASASFIIPAFLMVLFNLGIFQTVVRSSKQKTVKSNNGSLRVHRGKRKPTIDSKSIIKKLERSDTLQSFEQDKLNPDGPAMRTLFSHTVVFGILEAKKTNLINHITQRRMYRRSLRTELRVARTTGVVVSAFIVCWIPFTTIYVLQAYSLCTVAADCVPNSLFVVAFWLGYSNSAVNPLLYAAFSRDFRLALKRMVWKRRKN
ncbi:unnamed protein product [Caenorhabditis bovis]|uniref:G-protein coupled receptors family 1 profile domain-containing protein n=1 Tax=Caenorhabditis bovis TaxID=2654633 RepID=A0A8S1FDN4_9PELO|nr:unnamed protein product [Caenorhabditis bovis]